MKLAEDVASVAQVLAAGTEEQRQKAALGLQE